LLIAGRFKHGVDKQLPGKVTSLHTRDFKYIDGCLTVENEQITSACLSPTLDILTQYSEKFPDISFSKLLEYFEDMAWLDGNYFLCNWGDRKELADAIEHMPFPLKDRYVLTLAPVKLQQLEKSTFVEAAHGFGLMSMGEKFVEGLSSLHPCKFDSIQRHGVKLSDLSPFAFLSNVDSSDFKNVISTARNSRQLLEYEGLHRVCVLYLWLHYRFPDAFPDRIRTTEVKRTLEDCISDTLEAIKR
jgi:ATP-dependent RNA helicase SUPV3L1/SUV3